MPARHRQFRSARSDNAGPAELAAFLAGNAIHHNIPLTPLTSKEAIRNNFATFIRAGKPGIESIDFRIVNVQRMVRS